MEARCSPTHTPKCFGSHLPRASAWGEPLPPPAIPLLSKADQMVGAIPGQLQVREQTHRSSPRSSLDVEMDTQGLCQGPHPSCPFIPPPTVPQAARMIPLGLWKAGNWNWGLWGSQQPWCGMAAVSTCQSLTIKPNLL